MSSTGLLIVYCLLIMLVSLGGGWIPLLIRLTHRRMQVAVSLVAGVMLGVGLLHLLPHALLDAPEAMDAVFTWVLIGFLVMFFIERFLCFHHHDVPQVPTGPEDADHQHTPEHQPACAHAGHESHRLTWTGATIGLTLHTIIAGIALAASVQVESHASRLVGVAGLGTFLVIFLHKPFDAMTISTLMTFGAWSKPTRHLVNALFALMIPVGVMLFHLGLRHWHEQSHLVAYALAFSAGTFLCIAMSDLLPELQFHRHDRIPLSAALLLGLSVAWVIGAIETAGRGHGHDHPPAAQTQEQDHERPQENGQMPQEAAEREHEAQGEHDRE